MRIIGDTNFPFLKYKWIALCGSLIVIVAGLAYELLGPGLNYGIDFVGGTTVTVRFRDQPDLGRLRDALGRLGVGSPTVQRFDEVEKHEVLIRLENPEGEEGDFSAPILGALHDEFNPDLGSRFDLNTRGTRELLDELAAADPDAVGGDEEARAEHYRPMAEAVLEYRKEYGIFGSVDELDGIAAVSDGARSFLRDRVVAGGYAILGAESVGPAVGKDLRDKATLAIAFSIGAMLVYIWVRFQFAYGVGAVAAIFHDVLITLSALALTGREIELSTVAAILTLVGYSVNDTVVVFDRVRENLKLKRGMELEALMNASINQTLSRTLLTSGTTLIVVISLFLFGGEVINTFAFVLLVGILVGTYSSIFVASPVALGISRFLARRKARRVRGR